LTAGEVATMLKVSRRMVYALHERGLLVPSHQLPAAGTNSGRSREGFRWTRSDVEHFLHRYMYRPTAPHLPADTLRDFVPVELPSKKKEASRSEFS
jgi:hypothetical protein